MKYIHRLYISIGGDDAILHTTDPDFFVNSTNKSNSANLPNQVSITYDLPTETTLDSNVREYLKYTADQLIVLGPDCNRKVAGTDALKTLIKTAIETGPGEYLQWDIKVSWLIFTVADDDSGVSTTPYQSGQLGGLMVKFELRGSDFINFELNGLQFKNPTWEFPITVTAPKINLNDHSHGFTETTIDPVKDFSLDILRKIKCRKASLGTDEDLEIAEQGLVGLIALFEQNHHLNQTALRASGPRHYFEVSFFKHMPLG